LDLDAVQMDKNVDTYFLVQQVNLFFINMYFLRLFLNINMETFLIPLFTNFLAWQPKANTSVWAVKRPALDIYECSKFDLLGWSLGQLVTSDKHWPQNDHKGKIKISLLFLTLTK